MIPQKSWKSQESYDATLEKLESLFAENFRKKYSDVSDTIKSAGPF